MSALASAADLAPVLEFQWFCLVLNFQQAVKTAPRRTLALATNICRHLPHLSLPTHPRVRPLARSRTRSTSSPVPGGSVPAAPPHLAPLARPGLARAVKCVRGGGPRGDLLECSRSRGGGR